MKLEPADGDLLAFQGLAFLVELGSGGWGGQLAWCSSGRRLLGAAFGTICWVTSRAAGTAKDIGTV